LFQEEVIDKGTKNAIVRFFAYRGNNGLNLAKNEVEYYFEAEETEDVLASAKDYEMDLIKEINVNTNLLNIHVHSPENIYGKSMHPKMIWMMLYY
jgi:branched-chain amino acid aminotransferase